MTTVAVVAIIIGCLALLLPEIPTPAAFASIAAGSLSLAVINAASGRFLYAMVIAVVGVSFSFAAWRNR